jgi:hypothetical protein
VPGSHRRQWALYEILNRLVLIERFWRLYTSEIVILQVVASVELTLFQPPTVVHIRHANLGMRCAKTGPNRTGKVYGVDWISCLKQQQQ